MEKSLSERVATRIAEKKTILPHKDQNRAVFLALRLDITQALNDGWSVKSIWETLHAEGKITFCYSSFCDYTNRLIRLPPNHVPEHAHGGDGVGKTQKPATTTTIPGNKGTTEISGFTFNPSPNKEDLI